MTKRNLLSMALKFTGIVYSLHSFCFFLGLIREWPRLIGQHITNLNIYGLWAINITSTLANILLSLTLIRWGDCLARWLVPHDASVYPLHNDRWEQNLFEVTLKFLSSLYLLWGLPGLVTDGISKAFQWTILTDGQARFYIFNPFSLKTVLIGIALIAMSHLLVSYAFQGKKGHSAPDNVT